MEINRIIGLYYAIIVYFYLELISLMEVSCVISLLGPSSDFRLIALVPIIFSTQRYY